jgi:cobalt-precorrin 5A hydrolase
VPERKVAEAVDGALESLGLDGRCIAGVASINLKKTEAGLLGFCENRGLSCVFFGASELRAAEGSFSGSDFVREVAGVDNVCERAAVLASRGGKLIKGKTARHGVTAAAAIKEVSLRF